MGSPLRRDLVTAHNIAPSTVRLQPGGFRQPGGFTRTGTNARERRLTVTFTTANAPVVVMHGLGFTPSGFTTMGTNTAGVVYGDIPLSASRNVIVLKCDVANTVADILVR